MYELLGKTQGTISCELRIIGDEVKCFYWSLSIPTYDTLEKCHYLIIREGNTETIVINTEQELIEFLNKLKKDNKKIIFCHLFEPNKPYGNKIEYTPNNRIIRIGYLVIIYIQA